MTLDLLLILHIFGLLMGAGGGFASALIMRRAATATPEQAMTIRSLGPMLQRFSTVGLVLMWLTGPPMAMMLGGFRALPSLFWVKFFFVLTLTGAAIAAELTYAEIKKGNVKVAPRLAVIGPIAGLSSILAMAFAVLTFH